MAFLCSLGDEATLLDVFRKFSATAHPLLEYHEALMRGPSPLSIAERELLAAYVSGLNACHYCFGVHTVTAENFGVEEGLLEELLENPAKAPIDARMKPILSFARKLTLTPSRMSQEDADQVFAEGWDEQALHDAVSVCALFNFMNRLVEGLGIKTNSEYFKTAGERLASAGYVGLLKMLRR
jgi:uncharacterized peroxidase-related enzyme